MQKLKAMRYNHGHYRNINGKTKTTLHIEIPTLAVGEALYGLFKPKPDYCTMKEPHRDNEYLKTKN